MGLHHKDSENTMNASELRTAIIETFREVAEMNEVPFDFDALTDETILFETGLDSLGFAILITRLEMVLGYDPFIIMETPVYPRTFGELLAGYENYRHLAKSVNE